MDLKVIKLVLSCYLLMILLPVHAQEISAVSEPQAVADGKEVLSEEETEEIAAKPIVKDDASAREVESELNEDPEAQRRSQIEEEPGLRSSWPKIDFYGSVRLHAIKHFDETGNDQDIGFGDGASRIGVRGEWDFSKKWWLFGRAEAGFDVLDTFTAKGSGEDDNKGLESRLLYGGINSDRLALTFGKNWSSYYKIAGMADRFSIFGGQATGVYNAGTDGGATGTGRANDVIQIKLYTSSLKALKIKPFNLNVQFQEGQPIPHVKNRHYGKAWGASVWLETQSDRGLGIAVQSTDIEDLEDPLIKEAGIDGDAVAVAASLRFFGDHWYTSLVLSRLENVATTNTFKYINGYGAVLYTQWEFKDRWWMVAGGNWLNPDNDDEDAGEYDVKYGVIGLRYTFDSFKRMLYAEYRIDYGNLVDGTERKNEITFGVRWDFGY
jgi:predicted porin